MSCGCTIGHITFDSVLLKGTGHIVDKDCLLPEAVEIIRGLLLSSAWQDVKANRDAEAFLKKLD